VAPRLPSILETEPTVSLNWNIYRTERNALQRELVATKDSLCRLSLDYLYSLTGLARNFLNRIAQTCKWLRLWATYLRLGRYALSRQPSDRYQPDG
jgi:hypothetical protein